MGWRPRALTIEALMTEAVNIALLLLAVAVAVPVMFLVLQLGAALLPAKALGEVSSALCPSIAVIMPAHNEEAIIDRTVDAILSQLPQNGRLLVVADNCTDSTARVASWAGAEVAVRTDVSLIGKGFALDHGLRVISADPPQVVVFVDADCVVTQGSLEILIKRCASTGRPVQARYSMLAPPSASPADKISQLAWVIKTLARPLGSARLGLPCQLMGSGMALPFETARQLDLATGHLAEDQKFAAELAMMGKAPCFCPQAHILSQFPEGESGKRQQRTRWQHGHLAIIGEFFRPMTARAISTGSLQLLAFTLDLCIPPLSLLILVLLATEATTMVWFAAVGFVAPLIVSSASLGFLAVAIGAAWWRLAREVVSLRELTALPAYCLQRFASFLRYFVNRQIEWIRTER
jgi:cellulose synthase/poly-beta-1,6-N-acetylglucosamine synthase-like glycosyltransferase